MIRNASPAQVQNSSRMETQSSRSGRLMNATLDPRSRRQQAILELILHHLAAERLGSAYETLKQEYTGRYGNQPPALNQKALDSVLDDTNGQSPLAKLINQDSLNELLRISQPLVEQDGIGSQKFSTSSPKKRLQSGRKVQSSGLARPGSTRNRRGHSSVSDDISSTGNRSVTAAIVSQPGGSKLGRSKSTRLTESQRKQQEEDSTVYENIDRPPSHENELVLEKAAGQAIGGRGSDGAGQPVIQIKAASLDMLIEHLFYAIATSDQEKNCGLSVIRREVTAGQDMEDLQIGDLFFSTLHKMLESLAIKHGYSQKSKTVPAATFFIDKMMEYFDKYCRSIDDMGYFLVLLRVARFWLRRHCHRMSRMARGEMISGIEQFLQEASPVLHDEVLSNVDPRLKDMVSRYRDEVHDLLALARKALTLNVHRPLRVLQKEFSGDVPLSAFELSAIPNAWCQRRTPVTYDVPKYRYWISVPPKLLAASWTFGEWCLFRNIPLYELLDAGWDDPRCTHTADAIYKFIDRYQADSLWVANEVVRANAENRNTPPPSVKWDTADPPIQHGSPSDRAAMIVRFVTLAKELRALRNFCGLSAILQGLRLKGLNNRLPETWQLLPEQTKNDISRLHVAVSDANHYNMYHQATDDIDPEDAIVPHLGAHTLLITMYNTFPDLVNVNCTEFNPDSEQPPLLHINKWRKIYSEVLVKLLSWQERTYPPAEMLPTVPKEKRPKRTAKAPVVEPPSEVLELVESQIYRCVFEFEDDREEVITSLLDEAMHLESEPVPQESPGYGSVRGFEETAMDSI